MAFPQPAVLRGAQFQARPVPSAIFSGIDVAQSFDGEASEAAGRYAQAAFELARDSGALDTLEKDFLTFSNAWTESADLREAARSPMIEPDVKAKALIAVAEKLGISDLGRKIIGVAAQNRRAGELPGVISAYRALLSRHRGARRAEIVSARPLSASEQTAILESLSKSLGAKIDAETRVDESLIGGFVVRVGSRQFDASLKSKLDALKLALKSA